MPEDTLGGPASSGGLSNGMRGTCAPVQLSLLGLVVVVVAGVGVEGNSLVKVVLVLLV